MSSTGGVALILVATGLPVPEAEPCLLSSYGRKDVFTRSPPDIQGSDKTNHFSILHVAVENDAVGNLFG